MDDKQVNKLLTLHLSMSSMLLEASNYFVDDDLVQDTILKSQEEYSKFQDLMAEAIKQDVSIAYDIDRSITKKLPKNNIHQILKLIENSEKEADDLTASLTEKQKQSFKSFKAYLKEK